jgi:eukaryotic-like serine/threonine-protein kinase
MTIAPGTKLDPYEILSAIGAGGMGEVYRARDPKLGRDVAIKVLPEAFARDAERMARFQREAKVLVSLDHPNIATIHGLEESGGTRALVMQLVEGPTLADRIKAGSVPVDEAVRIARQIADAPWAAILALGRFGVMQGLPWLSERNAMAAGMLAVMLYQTLRTRANR